MPLQLRAYDFALCIASGVRPRLQDYIVSKRASCDRHVDNLGCGYFQEKYAEDEKINGNLDGVQLQKDAKGRVHPSTCVLLSPRFSVASLPWLTAVRPRCRVLRVSVCYVQWSLLCAFRFSRLNLNPAERRPAPETVSAGRHRLVYPPLPAARQNRLVKTHPSHQREAGVNDADQPCSGSELSRSISNLIY